MLKKLNKGFTLIELLVVIAIIGILASVVLASLNTARTKSRDARRVADINQIKLALELYFDANSEYPDVTSKLAPAFIPAVPADPLGGVYLYNAYITSTHPPVATDDCADGAPICVSYHLGASLEESTASALDGDLNDDGDTVKGTDANDCAGVAGRFCYDVRP